MYYCRQIYWLSVNLTADLEETCQEICWKEWEERYFCQKIYWLSINLPADFEETGYLPAKIRDFCKLMYWLSVILPAYLETENLLAEMAGGVLLQADLLSASRLTHYQLICWQILRRQSENMLKEMGRQVFLPENLLTVKNSASRLWGDRKSASKNRRFLQTDILTVS